MSVVPVEPSLPDADCAAPVSILKGTAEVAISSVLLQCISGASFFFLVRSLDSDGYGKYSIVVSATASLFSFAGNWVVPYMVAEGSRQYNARGVLSDVYWSCASFSMVCAIVLLPAVFFTLPAGNLYRVAALPMVIGAAGLPLLRGGYQIVGDFRGYGRLMWLDRAVFLMGLLLLRAAGPIDAAHAVGAAAVAQIAALAFGARTIYRRIDWKFRDFVPGRFISESLPTLLAALATYFSSAAFAILMFSRLFGASAAGAVSASFVLAGFAGQPALWLSPVLLPRFALGNKASDDVRSYLSRFVIPAAGIYVGLIACASLLAPFAVSFLGAGFQPYRAVFPAILATVTPEAVHMLLIPVLFGQGRSKAVMAAAAIKAAVFLAAAFSGSGFFGIALALPLAAWVGAAIEAVALRGALTPDERPYVFLIGGLAILPMFGTSGCIVAMAGAAVILWIRNRSFPFLEMVHEKAAIG